MANKSIKNLSIKRVSITENQKETNGLTGVLSKFVVSMKGQEYYVKCGRRLYADIDILYPISEVIVHEIGAAMGFNVTPYELWEVPADNFMDSDELDEYSETKGSSTYLTNLRKIKHMLVCASKSFIPDEYHTYMSTESLGITETGKDLYDTLTNSGFYSKQYIDQMIVFDYLIYNIDRHINNFGYIITPDGEHYEAPLFDHGRSLFSDFYDNEVKEHGTHLTNLQLIKPFYELKESLTWVSKQSFETINLNITESLIDNIVNKYKPLIGEHRTKTIIELIVGRVRHVRKVLSET